MPNQTFFFLSEIIRQRITVLARAEFAAADYNNASITHIVKQAKIAKGSFYQYFEDKEDLYLYIIDLASQQRISLIQSAHAQLAADLKPKDFFAELRWMLTTSTMFVMQYPQLNQIIHRAYYGDSPVKEAALEIVLAAYKQSIRTLIEKGVANGDLRADLDLDLAVFIILTASNSLRYFIPEKLGLDTRQLAENEGVNIDIAAVDQIFDQLILVFKHGISST